MALSNAMKFNSTVVMITYDPVSPPSSSSSKEDASGDEEHSDGDTQGLCFPLPRSSVPPFLVFMRVYASRCMYVCIYVNVNECACVCTCTCLRVEVNEGGEIGHLIVNCVL